MIEKFENSSDELDTSAKDRGFSVAKATMSYIPFAGPALTELISVVIPNQRMDRFADFMRRLNRRVEALEAIIDERDGPQTQKIALIETGAEQSTRAQSTQRIERIASLVERGITQSEQEALELHRILRILPQIDDQELLVLICFGGSGEQRESAWSALHLPDRLGYGASDELRRKHQLFVLGLKRLTDMGLLDSKQADVEIAAPRGRRLDRSASVPKIQKRKVERANAHLAMGEYTISPLGRLLVEAIT